LLSAAEEKQKYTLKNEPACTTTNHSLRGGGGDGGAGILGGHRFQAAHQLKL
jgi:hypothetical protein